MKETLEVCDAWQELIDHAKNECVFGDPLDTELFKSCMKDAFECLFASGRKESFEMVEAELLCQVYGYSCIPAVTESDDSLLFEASLCAAGNLAWAILHPGAIRLKDSKMISEIMLDGKVQEVVYDFETGNMKDYVRLAEEGLSDLL
jgi:hypothetical protein